MQGKTIPAVSDGEICDCEIARGKHGGAITDGSSLGSAFAALVKTLVLGDQRVIHVGRQKVVRGCLRALTQRPNAVEAAATQMLRKGSGKTAIVRRFALRSIAEQNDEKINFRRPRVH